MTVRGSSTWTRGAAALLALVTVLTFSAPPCDAGETPQATPKASEKRSLSASAAAHVEAMAPARALAQDPTATAAASESRSFFRTRTGVAAIVLMVAGAAYVGYKIPKDNGKVHSPIR